MTVSPCLGHVSLAVLSWISSLLCLAYVPSACVSMAVISLPSSLFCFSLRDGGGEGTMSHVALAGLKLTSMCHHTWFVWC